MYWILSHQNAEDIGRFLFWISRNLQIQYGSYIFITLDKNIVIF